MERSEQGRRGVGRAGLSEVVKVKGGRWRLPLGLKGGNLVSMRGREGQIRGGWNIWKMLLVGLFLWGCFEVGPLPAVAEIVKRNLGKNSNGETVTGYVFQPGRSYRRRPRSSSSVFGGRPARSHSARGIDYGYRYPFYAPSFYYYVPRTFSHPIHHYHHGGGRLSVHVSF